jgi:glycosyltransferase A (GT-A) superfamily protein (DUF2064 family)
MRRPQPAVFADIAWSTARVYRQTLRRAEQLGLGVAQMAEWYDVDEPADLDHLQRHLESLPSTTARHTRAALQQLALAVVAR